MKNSKIRWPVKARNIDAYHKIYDINKLAKIFEVTKRTISEYLFLAEIIKNIPELSNYNKKEVLNIVKSHETIEEIENELRRRGQKIFRRNYD